MVPGTINKYALSAGRDAAFSLAPCASSPGFLNWLDNHGIDCLRDFDGLDDLCTLQGQADFPADVLRFAQRIAKVLAALYCTCCHMDPVLRPSCRRQE